MPTRIMLDEKRVYPRLPMSVEIELSIPGTEPRVLRTADLSHSGLLVEDTGARPPLGTPVEIRVLGTLGGGAEPPLVRGRVVRHTPEGFAVAFDDSAHQEGDAP